MVGNLLTKRENADMCFQNMHIVDIKTTFCQSFFPPTQRPISHCGKKDFGKKRKKEKMITEIASFFSLSNIFIS